MPYPEPCGTWGRAAASPVPEPLAGPEPRPRRAQDLALSPQPSALSRCSGPAVPAAGPAVLSSYSAEQAAGKGQSCVVASLYRRCGCSLIV